MRILGIVSLCVALGGCAGQTIKEKMATYAGQPASVLFGKLGYPTSEQTIANSKAYIWATNRFIDGSSYGCKIRVIVDPQDMISAWDFEGNEGGCAQYASVLR
jgi:hypothetical protein